MGPIVRDQAKSKFNPPRRRPNPVEQKPILKQVLKVAINVAMTNHHYRFNNLTYRQTDGGPIGDIWAQAGAKLIMIWWDIQFSTLTNKITLELNIRVMQRYVDDLNFKAGALPLGAFWNQDTQQVEIKPEDQLTQEELADIQHSNFDLIN